MMRRRRQPSVVSWERSLKCVGEQQVEEAGGVYVDTKFSPPVAVEDDRILPLSCDCLVLGKLRLNLPRLPPLAGT